jgi:hypothetical protein
MRPGAVVSVRLMSAMAGAAVHRQEERVRRTLAHRVGGVLEGIAVHRAEAALARGLEPGALSRKQYRRHHRRFRSHISSPPTFGCQAMPPRQPRVTDKATS